MKEREMSETLEADATIDARTSANAIRALAMDAVEKAKSGHPGMPMGMADVATVLFQRFMKFDASRSGLARPRPLRALGRTRLDAALRAAYLPGYPGMTMADLENFRQFGAPTPGHPEYGHAPGVETTTGPLGQGLATAVGMAIAERSHGRPLRRRSRRPLYLRHRSATAA